MPSTTSLRRPNLKFFASPEHLAALTEIFGGPLPPPDHPLASSPFHTYLRQNRIPHVWWFDRPDLSVTYWNPAIHAERRTDDVHTHRADPIRIQLRTWAVQNFTEAALHPRFRSPLP